MSLRPSTPTTTRSTRCPPRARAGGGSTQTPEPDDEAALTELAALPGFGARTAPWLLAIGIRSGAQLDRLLEPDDGAVQVYRALRASRPGVNLNALWVLEALRRGCSWQDITPARKADLRRRLADG